MLSARNSSSEIVRRSTSCCPDTEAPMQRQTPTCSGLDRQLRYARESIRIARATRELLKKFAAAHHIFHETEESV